MFYTQKNKEKKIWDCLENLQPTWSFGVTANKIYKWGIGHISLLKTLERKKK